MLVRGYNLQQIVRICGHNQRIERYIGVLQIASLSDGGVMYHILEDSGGAAMRHLIGKAFTETRCGWSAG
jgi:hypothetical protein